MTISARFKIGDFVMATQTIALIADKENFRWPASSADKPRVNVTYDAGHIAVLVTPAKGSDFHTLLWEDLFYTPGVASLALLRKLTPLELIAHSERCSDEFLKLSRGEGQSSPKVGDSVVDDAHNIEFPF